MSIYNVKYSVDNKFLLSCGEDRKVHIYSTTDYQEINTLSDFKDSVWILAFSDDNKTLAVGGADKVLRIYDWNHKKLKNSLKYD